MWGLTHNSVRVDLAGPVCITELLKEVEAKRGNFGKIKFWCNSVEVLGICNGRKIKRLHSRCYKRNMDFKLKRKYVEDTYGGEVLVCKVKGHQDKEVKYEDLSFEAQRNVDL